MNKFGKINWLIIGGFAVVFLSFVIVGVAVKLQTSSFVPSKNYAVSTQCTDTVTLIFPTLTPTITMIPTPTPPKTPTPTSTTAPISTLTPTPSCSPRPACLDLRPFPCKMKEPFGGWCPKI
jgi:hypothetical protein